MIGMLVDVTRCTGCYECVQACARTHGQNTNSPALPNSPDGLSAERFATLLETQPEATGSLHYVRKFCQHCLEPACVSVCPVGAMYRDESGAVLYDFERCMGCRYCMMACPYGIPRYEWSKPAPKVRKCTFCIELVKQGQKPACVTACPNGALQFGERTELIKLAHQKILSEPQRYLPKVHGEHTVGGTAVLYLTDIPLDFLGYQGAPGNTPRPELSAAWLEQVPGIAVAAAGMMTGLFWIIGRRMQFEERRQQRGAHD